MKYSNIAILGIHTGIGKTIASAVITEALQADYWKPVQAGELDNSDSINVRNVLSNEHSVVHPERYRLELPMSPHAAAAAMGINVSLHDFVFPKTQRLLIVETAGGVFSPMTSTETMLDFVAHFELPAILVSGAYLGSINHTLLCLDAISSREIPLLGMIYSGERNEASETFIADYHAVPNVAHIPFLPCFNPESVRSAATGLAPILKQWVH